MDALSRMSQRVIEGYETPDPHYGLATFTLKTGPPYSTRGEIAYGPLKYSFNLLIAACDSGVVQTQDPNLGRALANTRLFNETKGPYMPGLAPPALELAYAERDTAFAPGTAALTPVPGLVIALTADLTMKYFVRASVPLVSTISGQTSYIQILEDGIAIASGFTFSTTGGAAPVTMNELVIRRSPDSPVPLTAGIHQYAVSMGAFGGVPSTGFPCYLGAYLI